MDNSTTPDDLEGAVSRAVTLDETRHMVVHLTDEGVIFDVHDEQAGTLSTVGMTFEEWAEFIERADS